MVREVMSRETRITLTLLSWTGGLVLTGAAFFFLSFPGYRWIAIPLSVLAIMAWAPGGIRPFVSILIDGGLWAHPIRDWQMLREPERTEVNHG